MPSRTPSLLMLLGMLGCAGSNAVEQPGNGGNSSAIIIRNAQMTGTVLESIRTHVPAVRIGDDPGQCPRIVFRGDLSARFRRDPSVYVDKTLMADTCILSSILAQDVDYIEVYPSGLVSDGSIRRNPAGVILIYRRTE